MKKRVANKDNIVFFLEAIILLPMHAKSYWLLKVILLPVITDVGYHFI